MKRILHTAISIIALSMSLTESEAFVPMDGSYDEYQDSLYAAAPITPFTGYEEFEGYNEEAPFEDGVRWESFPEYNTYENTTSEKISTEQNVASNSLQQDKASENSSLKEVSASTDDTESSLPQKETSVETCPAEETSAPKHSLPSEGEKYSVYSKYKSTPSRIKWWTNLTLPTRRAQLAYRIPMTLKKCLSDFDKLGEKYQQRIIDSISSLQYPNKEDLVIKHTNVLPYLCSLDKNTREKIIAAIRNYESQPKKNKTLFPLVFPGISQETYRKYFCPLEEITRIVEADGVIGEIPDSVKSKRRKQAIKMIPTDGFGMRFRIEDWNQLGQWKNRIINSGSYFSLKNIQSRLKMMGTVDYQTLRDRMRMNPEAFRWWKNIEKQDRYNLLVLHPGIVTDLDKLSSPIRTNVLKIIREFECLEEAEKMAGIALSVRSLGISDALVITHIQRIINEDYRQYFEGTVTVSRKETSSEQASSNSQD